MSEKLKPCPFCGGDVSLVEKGNLLVFLCEPSSPCIGSGLGNYGMASKRETAIETWNTRRIRWDCGEPEPTTFERCMK